MRVSLSNRLSRVLHGGLVWKEDKKYFSFIRVVIIIEPKGVLFKPFRVIINRRNAVDSGENRKKGTKDEEKGLMYSDGSGDERGNSRRLWKKRNY